MTTTNPILRFADSLSGHWAVNLETKVPRVELYETRIASSKPSLGFFVLLISSAVIATLGLISNSTAVVIGAMIVSPLMDSILSLAFGLAVSDGQLIRRSAVTVTLGVTAVVSTSAIISLLLGLSGGELGVFSRADDAALWSACQDLELNTPSQPIRTEYGYHLIEVQARYEASSVRPLEQVRGQIVEKLVWQKHRQRMDQLVETLKNREDWGINAR